MPSFEEARDFLLAHREDYATAYAGFRWPEPVAFNWALDWFDGVLATRVESRDRPALWLVDGAGAGDTILSFAALAARSNRVANHLRRLGLRRGQRLLLLLGNVAPLWETMLAAMKLGIVIIPATTLLTPEELADRLERGQVAAIVTGSEQTAKFAGVGEGLVRIAMGAGAALPPGWLPYEAAFQGPEGDACFVPDAPTAAEDPLLLYFTSGTTAKPKLVLHTHRSYPVGSLSTMYWIGLRPGDIHLNISSPGWAKHAWSCVFAPWNAGATVFLVNQPRFEARSLLAEIVRAGVTTLCAPPTVWRLLVQQDLAAWPTALREVVGAGEPLNPEIIDRVKAAWGLTIRDGYGQTETTAQIANSPGQKVKLGSMGRPLPGYRVRLLDAGDAVAGEGEACLVSDAPGTAARPAGLMAGYASGSGAGLSGGDGPVHRTGDIASQDAEGYLTFIGRTDDVFKSSDYRISPFELESVLIEHPDVAEAAVVPSPDPVRLAVPKGYVSLVAGTPPSREVALSIFRMTRERLAPYKRIRRLELVSDLPKTISGKIRRVQLRRLEESGDRSDPLRGVEFLEEAFPELRE